MPLDRKGKKAVAFRPSLSQGLVCRMDGRLERTCKHGIGHTTPASARTLDKKMGWDGTASVHGCDGCCGIPGFFKVGER